MREMCLSMAPYPPKVVVVKVGSVYRRAPSPRLRGRGWGEGKRRRQALLAAAMSRHKRNLSIRDTSLSMDLAFQSVAY